MATIPGLDRKRLAERMETTPGTITKKLQNPEKIDGIWLEKFRAGLNLPDIFDLYRDPSAPTPNELLRGLTDEQRSEVVRFVDFVRQRSGADG
jgi:hypothetical protein